MNLIGRYEKIRWLSARSLSAPYILDRKWSQFKPAGGAEWWRSPDGIWIPVVSGGVGFQSLRSTPPMEFGGYDFGTITFTSIAISSAYTAGSAGAGVAMRFVAPGSMTLNDIYFNITSFNGTASAVNDIDYEVRTGSLSAPTMTGGALVASGTKDPASTTGWIHISGLSVSLSAGPIWIILADADGSGTNFANILRSHNSANAAQSALITGAVSTANGFSSLTHAGSAGIASIVCCFSSGGPIGSSITAQTAVSNNTARRGLYMDGLLAPLSVYAWYCPQTSSNISGIELYDGSTNPGGTPLASSTQGIGATNNGPNQGAILASPYTLAAQTIYRLVFTFGGNFTGIRKLQIGTGTDANLRKAMPHGLGGWYYAYANGTTNWANDDVDAFPDMAIAIDDQVAPAASGGLLVHPGMTGGMRG